MEDKKKVERKKETKKMNGKEYERYEGTTYWVPKGEL